MTIRTIVVDDSIIFRKVVRDALAMVGDVQVIDVAKDGQAAVEKICRLQPDLVTLDVEMPGLDGLQVLEELKRRRIKTNIIMVSSLTDRGAEATTRALSLGALDFILKPSGENNVENLETLRRDLEQRLAVVRGDSNSVMPTSRVAGIRSPLPSGSVEPTNQPTTVPSNADYPERTELIVIGISTGGPKALGEFIPRLPKNFPIPIVIVQHMPPIFTGSMAKHLDSQSQLNVVEATDGVAIRPGSVFIAPGGTQFSLALSASGLVGRVTDEPAVRGCKPSVDHLLHSIPTTFIPSTLTLIMTGMGDDGTEGARRMHQLGGTVWAQSQASCTVFGMPRHVIEQGIAQHTFDLAQLHERLYRLTSAMQRIPRPVIGGTSWTPLKATVSS